jgi:hypothetical protein
MAENVKYLDPVLQKELMKALFENPDLIPEVEREKLFRDMIETLANLDGYVDLLIYTKMY